MGNNNLSIVVLIPFIRLIIIEIKNNTIIIKDFFIKKEIINALDKVKIKSIIAKNSIFMHTFIYNTK